MLFVTLMKGKAGSTFNQRVARRLGWNAPSGMRVVAEYWLASEEPGVVVVSEAEDALVILNALREWDDVFESTVVPCVAAEDGLAFARKELAAAQA